MKFERADFPSRTFPVSLAYRLDDGRRWRHCVEPGDDLSALPPALQERIRVHWKKLGGAPAWKKINNPPEPSPTAADITTEARRRIDLVAGVSERADMALEWQALRDKQAAGTLSDADKKRAAELEAIWQRIEAVKEAGKALAAQDPLQVDYANSAHWPG